MRSLFLPIMILLILASPVFCQISGEQTIDVNNIAVGLPDDIQVNIDIGVKTIHIIPKGKIEYGKIEIRKYDSVDIQSPPGTAYSYFSLNSNINKSLIKELFLEMEIKKSWMIEKDLDFIKLWRYSGNWSEIPIEITGVTNESILYESNITNISLKDFSYFSIAGDTFKLPKKIENTTKEIECINKTVSAEKNGRCIEFPNSCIPEGWTAVERCVPEEEIMALANIYRILYIILFAVVFFVIYKIYKFRKKDSYLHHRVMEDIFRKLKHHRK